MEQIDKPFKLVSPYSPTGDQPEAIAKLVRGHSKEEIRNKPCWESPVREKPLPWRMSLRR